MAVDSLSQPSGGAPTELAFTLDGRFVVVAETFTSKIDTCKVVHGVAQPGNFQPSAGPLPFSCAINHGGFLLVSEIGNPDLSTFASSVSSYSTAVTGENAIDLALSPDHRYLYSRATISNTITAFAVGGDGHLTQRAVLRDVPVGASGLIAR